MGVLEAVYFMRLGADIDQCPTLVQLPASVDKRMLDSDAAIADVAVLAVEHAGREKRIAYHLLPYFFWYSFFSHVRFAPLRALPDQGPKAVLSVRLSQVSVPACGVATRSSKNRERNEPILIILLIIFLTITTIVYNVWITTLVKIAGKGIILL